MLNDSEKVVLGSLNESFRFFTILLDELDARHEKMRKERVERMAQRRPFRLNLVVDNVCGQK